MPKIIEVLILDALIGNGDRHQENMAFVNTFELISDTYKKIKESGEASKNWGGKFIIWLLKISSEGIDFLKKVGHPIPKAAYRSSNINFAPIYDSGSSLGRELTAEKLNSLLKNETEFEAYISRGKSEIHWEGGLKLTHFQLLSKLLNSNYKTVVVNIIQSLQTKWNEENIKDIVYSIDKNLPNDYHFYSIPLNRKELIYKILTSRFKKLEKLLND